jgi:S-DNA-T family DNA segregation ATPase FtsK/SpoIIIE
MSARVNLSGERYNSRGVPFRPESVRIPLSVVIVGVIGRWLGRVVMTVVRRPALWAPLLAVAMLLRLVGAIGLLTAFATASTALAAWWRLHPTSFRRRVRLPARAVWRRVFVYRRGWQPAMVTCGLDVRVVDRQYLPQLGRVTSTGAVDRVQVRMLPGQVLEDYAEKTDRLAMTLGAVECRVRTGRRHGELELWLLVDDPLNGIVEPFESSDGPADYAGLPVARREDAETYQLRLLGNHVLVAGATGAGKGSVLWSIAWALRPGIADRSAELWVLDPKGGMEFAAGAPLFARYCYGDTSTAVGTEAVRTHETAFADFLEEAVAIMRARQAELRGVTRLHEPTPGDPLVVVFVDELASLTAYVTDRDAKNRIKAALSLLLSQGRAVGVVVVAALQDPRKEVLSFRDLFPTRIALRLTEPEQVDMTLGDGARRRGARCDEISERLPGTGYVVLDGIAEPIRVRFPFISDDHIGQMTDRAVDEQLNQLTSIGPAHGRNVA